MTSRARVLEALGEVYDPELDEPITKLRFVTSCEVSADGDVDVRLRLPTPQCAPNFAYLMAADARDAMRRLPEVRHVTVLLEGHYTGEEINAAIEGGKGFGEAFPGETRGRAGRPAPPVPHARLWWRASRACASRCWPPGATAEEVTALRVAGLPQGDPEAQRCLELRERLGIAVGDDAAAFVLPDGRPIAATELRHWLRTARLVRLSLETNGGICRSLLRVRYDLPDTEEVAA